MLYNITPIRSEDVITLKIGFGETAASNDEIVKEVKGTLEGLELEGRVCQITGPASLPVAMVIAHYVAHRFSVVACYDPKMQKYVVTMSHSSEHPIGATL